MIRSLWRPGNLQPLSCDSAASALTQQHLQRLSGLLQMLQMQNLQYKKTVDFENVTVCTTYIHQTQLLDCCCCKEKTCLRKIYESICRVCSRFCRRCRLQLSGNSESFKTYHLLWTFFMYNLKKAPISWLLLINKGRYLLGFTQIISRPQAEIRSLNVVKLNDCLSLSIHVLFGLKPIYIFTACPKH